MRVSMAVPKRGVLLVSTLAVAVTVLGCHSASATLPAHRSAAASRRHAAETDMRKLPAFKRYLSAVMKHYKNFFGPGKRGIANYQVWNEANISTFWTGTQAQMGQLVRAAWQVRQKVDRGA